MAPIGVGIIGLSAKQSTWASSAHSSPLQSAPLNQAFKLLAVGASSPKAAKKSAEAHGVSVDKAYSSPEAMADDEDIDLVVVSVKTYLHKQIALPALHAQKSVFIEWPLGKGLQEAEELAAFAKKQGVRTAIGLQERFLPSVQKAKSIIDAGVLGRIIGTTFIASSSTVSNLPVEKTYLMDPESGANLVTIPTIHSLDALCYLLGEFKFFNANIATTFPELRYIQADGTKGKPIKNNGADSISIQGVLESGASATYMFSSTSEATPAYFEWIIFGEEGSLKFRGPNHLMAMAPHTLYRSAQPKRRRRKEGKGGGGGGGLYATKEAGKWEEVEVGTPGPFGGIGEVYAAFAKGDKDLVDFDGAVRRHRMVEAIFRSSKNGTRESY